MEELFLDTKIIYGVEHRTPRIFNDDRGWLAEFFRQDETEKAIWPVMGYISVTNPGASRGPHEHIKQTDYFVFPGIGRFLFAVWDNREESETFRKRIVTLTEEDKPFSIIIPPRVVHAYHCFSKSRGCIINVPNKLFKGENRHESVDEVRYEDDPASPFRKDFERLILANLR